MKIKKLFILLFSLLTLISCKQKEEVKQNKIPTNSGIVIPDEVQAGIKNRIIDEASGSIEPLARKTEQEIIDEMKATATGSISNFDCRSKYRGRDRHYCEVEKIKSK